MQGVAQINRPRCLGGQVVLAENIQVGIECIRRALVPRQLQAQRRDLRGAQVIIALGAAQPVTRQRLGLQAEYRQAVQVRACLLYTSPSPRD